MRFEKWPFRRTNCLPRWKKFPGCGDCTGLLLGVPHRLKPGDFDADGFCIAPGYARNDPVCSGKAMAALIAEVRADKYPPGSILVFIHTGGTLATYADPVGMLGSGT